MVPLLGEQIAGMDIPTELKNALIAAAGAAIGAATGGTAGAISGLTATVNNYLNHNRSNMLRLSEREQFEAAASACSTTGDAAACSKRDELAALSAQRDRDLAQACSGQTPGYCNDQKSQAIAMGNRVFTTPSGFTYANSPLYAALNIATIGPVFDPRTGTFQDSASRSLAEGLLLEAGNQAFVGLIGAAATGVGITGGAIKNFFASKGVVIPEEVATRIATNFGRDGDQFTTAAAQMAAAKNANWVTAEGRTWWPPGSGNVPGSEFQTVLPVGAKLDRYGGTTPRSTFLAPSGTPIEQRALSPATNMAVRDEYVVLKPLPVEQSNTMPWFGKQGMGVQFDTSKGSKLTIDELVEKGFLRKVTP